MFFKSRCYNGGNEHKYKAVYNKIQADWVNRVKKLSGATEDVMFERHYVKHFCVWCGKEMKA
jgi:hypothetical protein